MGLILGAIGDHEGRLQGCREGTTVERNRGSCWFSSHSGGREYILPLVGGVTLEGGQKGLCHLCCAVFFALVTRPGSPPWAFAWEPHTFCSVCAADRTASPRGLWV